jgi:transposase-like protein
MFKGRHFDRSVILLCVRWYLAYSLSLRDLEEMMAERGIAIDHATVGRWVVRYSPELLKRFNRCKRPVSRTWHVDETYFKVRGRWMYLYRAIDSSGDTVEFWFSERRNLTAAKRFLRKALTRHGRPERIVIDGSQTNREAIVSCDTANRLQDRPRREVWPIRIRQSAYLNNRIEQGIVNLSKLEQFECITRATKPLKVRNPGRPETGTKHAKAVKLTMPSKLRKWRAPAIR